MAANSSAVAARLSFARNGSWRLSSAVEPAVVTLRVVPLICVSAPVRLVTRAPSVYSPTPIKRTQIGMSTTWAALKDPNQ